MKMIMIYIQDHIFNRPRRRHGHKFQDIAFLGKIMSLCNKQHLSNI